MCLTIFERFKKYPILNDVGPKVEEVQKLLQKAGSNIAVNGKFTVGMVAAIRSFQKKAGIEVTGKLDSKTMKALRKWKA